MVLTGTGRFCMPGGGVNLLTAAERGPLGAGTGFRCIPPTNWVAPPPAAPMMPPAPAPSTAALASPAVGLMLGSKYFCSATFWTYCSAGDCKPSWKDSSTTPSPMFFTAPITPLRVSLARAPAAVLAASLSESMPVAPPPVASPSAAVAGAVFRNTSIAA